MNIDVVSKDYIKTSTIEKVEIIINKVNLGSSVEVVALLKKQNGEYIDNKTFDISGQEYQQWGTDDSYLVNLVLQKLDLQKKA